LSNARPSSGTRMIRAGAYASRSAPLDYRTMGRALGCSAMKARTDTIRTIALFVGAIFPELSQCRCLWLAASPSMQALVGDLVERVIVGAE
jgi:hypothetical protein